MPVPLLPETMKSPSIWPNPHRLLILLGRSVIERFPSILDIAPRWWRFFLNTFARCDSIRRPYGLLMYRRMAEPETYVRCFSTRFNRFEISSGDWSSSRCVSTNVLRSRSSAIFLPTAREYFRRTYDTCCAYAASYGRPLRAFWSSYQMPLFTRLSVRAIEASEYPFAPSISISLRSCLLSGVHFVFFHARTIPQSFKSQRQSADL